MGWELYWGRVSRGLSCDCTGGELGEEWVEGYTEGYLVRREGSGGCNRGELGED